MTKIGVAILLLAAAAPLAAQEEQATTVNQGVKSAMDAWTGGHYKPPTCKELDNTGNFKVSSGRTYLKTAIEGHIPENQARELRDGRRVITEAITQNGRDQSASAWYFLGFIDLMQGDVAGGDSSLARAAQLAPQCKDEIDQLRGVGYIGLVNPGVDQMKAHHDDSASTLFREAASLAPDKPEAPYYLATLAFNAGRLDTAAVYFQQARKAAADDPKKADLQHRAEFYGGLALTNLGQPQQAVPLLQAYVQSSPADVDGKKALINAYNAAGMTDSAKVLTDQLLKSGDLTGGDAGGGASDAYNVAVQRYNDKQYAEAETALEQVIQANPRDHDALSLLLNTELILKNGDKLLDAAKKYVALEPLNIQAQKFLAEGYRQAGNVSERSKVAALVLRLPVDVTAGANSFTVTASGATLVLTAKGRQAFSAAGATIKPAPVTIEVHFLDHDGQPVSKQTAEIPALAPDSTQQIQVQAQGSGITSWSYDVKSGVDMGGAPASSKPKSKPKKP